MITDYASLQTDVAAFLARDDIDASIPDLIQYAEGRLRNDYRVRSMTCRGAFTITLEGESLPSDYAELMEWYHDGPTYYHPIEIVGLHQLALIKSRLGDTGVPRVAAIADDGLRVYFGPEPDAVYSTRMSYRRMLTALSATNTTNWLLTNHPHIYLYATLAESAPWLKDDERLATWEAALERRLEDLHITNERKTGSGQVHGRIHRPIGGM